MISPLFFLNEKIIFLAGFGSMKQDICLREKYSSINRYISALFSIQIIYMEEWQDQLWCMDI